MRARGTTQRSWPVKGAIDFGLISNAQSQVNYLLCYLTCRVLAAGETENYVESDYHLFAHSLLFTVK